jgi:Flp pilus assembly protein TadD
MRVSEGEYRLDALLREAKMMSSLGHLEDGLAVVEKMQASNNDASLDVRFYLAKIDILVHHKDYSRSYVVASEALKKHPKDFNMLFTRSMLSEKLGDIDGSIKDLEVLAAQQPENPDILNALGYTLANRTEQYARARGLLDKAMQLKPDNAAISDSMGWVLYKQGEMQEAERFIRKAYAMDPDPEIAAHLGEVLWVQGDRQQAEKVWQKALQDHPDHEALNTVIQQYQDKK